MRKVDIIAQRRVFDGLFKIDEAELRFQRHDGSMSPVVKRLNFERGDSAAALVINAERRMVYLTEQFRYSALEKAGGWLVEIVAGAIDDGETAVESARREVEEEIGFKADAIEEIADCFVSPGGTSERMVVFCAIVSDTGRMSAGGGVATENEDIKVVEWPVEEFLAKLAARELKDAKTIIAGMWLKQNAARLFGE